MLKGEKTGQWKGEARKIAKAAVAKMEAPTQADYWRAEKAALKEIKEREHKKARAAGRRKKAAFESRQTGGCYRTEERLKYEKQRLGRMGAASPSKRIEVSDEEKARLIALVGGGA